MKLRNILKQSDLFSAFDDKELDVFANIMSCKDYPDGHVFIRSGNAQIRAGEEAMYVIIKGKVLVRVPQHGEDNYSVVRLMDSGSAFGFLSLIDTADRSATCSAAGPVTAVSLNKSTFDHLYRSNETLASKFQFALAKQIAKDIRQLNQYLADSIRQQA